MLVLLFAAVAYAAAGDSSNDEVPVYKTVVKSGHDEDGLDAQRRLDIKTPGFATAIELEHEVGARPADALPEVLANTTGVTIRSLGGLGQYSAVSLRGSTAQQVAVFIDGVPLGTSVGGLVDLSDVPLDLLTRVEVYRGYVPIAFGSAAIGGAINLVAQRKRDGAPPLSTGIGGGSYGGKELRVAGTLRFGDADQLALRVGYATADGNFQFLDVNQTPSIPSRHSMSERTNNGYHRVVGQMLYQGSHELWRWRVQEILLSKKQGIPGTAQRQSTRSSLDTLNLQTIINVERKSFGGSGGRFEVASGFGYERRIFRDPLGEIGIAVDDERSEITDAYFSPRVRLPLWKGAFLSSVADIRHEWTGVDNRLRINPQGQQTTGDASRQRLGFGAGVELEQFLLGRRLLIAPALRIERVQSFFSLTEGQGEFADAGNDLVHLGIAPRLGVRAQLLESLELRMSGGRYFRPPNMLELFGDRGFIIGNEGLVPEEGGSVDVGFVIDLGKGGPFGLYAQTSAFVRKTNKLIQWQQAGLVLRSENIDGATIAGLEVGLSAWLWRDLVRAQANYTHLDTRNNSPSTHTNGKRLAGRPEHEAFFRVSSGYPVEFLGLAALPRLFYTFEFVAGNFLDPSGRRLVPARALHGLGLEVSLGKWLRAAFEVRNLLDRRTTTWTPPAENKSALQVPLSDFIGYPLPGRSFWMSVSGEFNFGSNQQAGEH